jgi:methylase of polypeptide subunit release factors
MSMGISKSSKSRRHSSTSTTSSSIAVASILPFLASCCLLVVVDSGGAGGSSAVGAANAFFAVTPLQRGGSARGLRGAGMHRTAAAAAADHQAAADLFQRARERYPLRSISETIRDEVRGDFLAALTMEQTWRSTSSKWVCHPSIDELTLQDFAKDHPEQAPVMAADMVKRSLVQAGFTAEGVRRRIGYGGSTGAASSSISKKELSGVGAAGPYHMRRHVDHTSRVIVPTPQDALDALIRLFLLGFTLAEEEAQRLLGGDLVRSLRSLGILSDAPLDACMLLSHVQIFPLQVGGQNLLLATDFPPPCSVTLKESPVMYIGPDSIALARQFEPGRVKRVLDMCCGSGIQGLVASLRYADRVYCADISPRATRFARFNAYLNGVADRVVVLPAGDLYDSLLLLEAGEQGMVEPFDVILSNPPFVPVPPALNMKQGAYSLFADGGSDGEDILKRIIAGAPRFLRPETGIVALVTELMNPETSPERLQLWWGTPAGESSYTLGVLHDEPKSASEYSRRRGGGDAGAWEAHLSQHGIESVSNALIFFSARRSGAHSAPAAGEPPGHVVVTRVADLWVPHSEAASLATQQHLRDHIT